MRQQEPSFGDFIRVSAIPTRKSPSARANRFREVTVDDLLVISSEEAAGRGDGQPLLTRQVEPKPVVSSLTDFPVFSPSGRGEIGCMPMPVLSSPALRAQAGTETDNFVAAFTSLKFSTDFHWFSVHRP